MLLSLLFSFLLPLNNDNMIAFLRFLIYLQEGVNPSPLGTVISTRGGGRPPPLGEGERFRSFFRPPPQRVSKNVFLCVELKNFRLQHAFMTYFRHI